jgi:methionine biosynthesis protein MetW
MKQQPTKIEHQIIMDWIGQGASVLDLGCGDGELLARLIEEKQVRAQGIEISEQAIHQCVAKGLSVFQEDIDTGLSEYADGSFDYVVLNQTFQQVKKPNFVLQEALRVSKKTLVGFPNFLYISARFQMFFRGKVPVTPSLPYEWYDTPNLHFLSIADFKEYCKKREIQIEQAAFIANNRKVRFFPNLFAETGLFLLSKQRYVAPS